MSAAQVQRDHYSLASIRFIFGALLCAALCLPGSSAALPAATHALAVQPVSVTATQAVLAYHAPDGNACQVQVSPSVTLNPLVYDVDPGKFAGSNLDSRAQIGSTTLRSFVVGARVAQRALDQNYYSRALQQGAQYYFSIICPSTGASGTGSFQTQAAPFGNTYADPLPVDPTEPGEYAWPTLSMSDRTQQIIDPQTGVLLRRISLPEDRDLTTANAAFANVRSGNWSNPEAALSNTDGNAAATLNGDNVSPLLLLPQNNVTFYGYINDFSGTRENNTAFLNWFQVTLSAATSNTACATNPTEDCNITACLTIDGVNCNPNGRNFSQALTPSATNYTFGTSGAAIDLWQNPGERPFNGPEIAIRQGSVSCDGSTTVNWTSGDYFAIFWTAGSVLTVNGVNYSIQQVNTTEHLQLAVSCPSTNGQSAPYTGMNFGVIVRKQTTSPDTISIQYASVNYQNGVFPYFDFTGEYDLCGTATVVGPSGNAGFNCSMYQNGQMYWIDGTTAETHLIALNQGNFSSPYTAACGSFDSIIFSSANPDVWYCGGQYPEQVQYFGNHSEPLNTTYPGYLEEQVNIPGCVGAPPTNGPCLAFTNLTGAQTIGALVQAFDASFDPIGFSNPALSHVENNLLVFRFWRSNYGTLGWTVLYDPSATSNTEPANAGCVGGGMPGCVVAAVASWSSPAARWCTLKSNDPMNVPGWSALGGYGWAGVGSGVAGAGPYISTVNDGTAFSTTVNAIGGPGACPPKAAIATGSLCTTVTVDAQPYNPAPCLVSSQDSCGGESESGAPGALGSAQVGDYFLLGENGTEVMRLAAIGGASNTAWTFQRGYNGTLAQTTANPQLETTCNSNPAPSNVNGGGEWYWNYTADPHGTDSNGQTTIKDPNGINAHFFVQNSALVNGYTLDPACGPAPALCYQNRIFSSIPALVSEGPNTVQTTNPAFNGIVPAAYGNSVQAHPAGPGWNATPPNALYYFDGRPFNGGPLSGSALSNGSSPATAVTGTLWKFSASQLPQLHRKLNATFAFSGYKALLDVSSTTQANTISGLPKDNYKYCVSNVAGECVTGSQTGDVYINAPYVQYPFCNFPAQATSMPDEFDLCIGDSGMIYNSITQINGAVTDTSGVSQRMLSKGLSRTRIADAFWHVHALANSNWLYFKTSYAQDVGDMVFALQLPSVPSPDSVDRTQFESFAITASQSLPAGTSAAYIEFGYGENGAPSNLYCTSRAEVCATASPAGSPLDLNAPFLFEQTEAAKLKPVPCSQGCTVNVPALPQHVVYYRWIFLNNRKAQLFKSPIYPLVAN